MATIVTTSGVLEAYTGTGAQTAYIVPGMENGLPVRPTIAVIGGGSDVFTLEEKLGGSGGDFVTSVSSSGGKITPQGITGYQEEIRVNITTNTSGSIKLYISFGN
jgi:hypothetical protein